MFNYYIQDDNHQGGLRRDVKMTEIEDGTLKQYPKQVV